MLRKKIILAAIVGSFLLAGCTGFDDDFVRPSGSSSHAKSGALQGAVIGALAGNALGEDSESTIVGAIGGAIIGGAVGSSKDNQEKAFRNVLYSSGVDIVDTGNSILLTLPSGLTFRTDQIKIKPEFMRQLNSIARVLNNYPKSKIKITGYTDDVGTYRYNLTLSEQRAYTVRNYLVNQGVSANRITTLGMGPDFPIASNDTKMGRQANRRVTIEVINREDY